MNMVCYPGDAALSSSSHDLDESWTSRMTIAQAIPARASLPTARSRFESMALRAGKVPPEAGDLLGVLIASTFPLAGRGCRVLRPLWAEEAMHRAYSFVRLIDTRSRHSECSDEDSIIAQVDDVIACGLALCFKDLTAGDERDVLPCFAVLRDVLTGLGALFGGPADITVEINIEEVWLPAYKRRALVLAASELVSNALLHAFRGPTAGKIEVGLTVQDPTAACLRVADNGCGFTDSSPNLDFGVGAGLAGLLEADLTYDRVAGWTIAEIEFPLAGS
jgi:two-component sensor histidine kinase